MDNNRIVTVDINFNSNDTISELKGPAVYLEKKANPFQKNEQRTENYKQSIMKLKFHYRNAILLKILG